jgi:hypothetical protein
MNPRGLSAEDRAVEAFKTLFSTFKRHPNAREVADYMGVSVNYVGDLLANARREERIPKFKKSVARNDQGYIQRALDRKFDEYVDMRLAPMLNDVRQLLQNTRLPSDHPSLRHLRRIRDDLKDEWDRKIALRDRVRGRMGPARHGGEPLPRREEEIKDQ